MVDTKDLYWIAGLIEGEGCFRINYTATNPYIGVQVRMTDMDVLEKIKDILKCGRITRPEIKKVGKPIYTWQINTQADAAAVIMTLYPLMCSRRQARMREVLREWKVTPHRQKTRCRKGHKKVAGSRCLACDYLSRIQREIRDLMEVRK